MNKCLENAICSDVKCLGQNSSHNLETEKQEKGIFKYILTGYSEDFGYTLPAT